MFPTPFLASACLCGETCRHDGQDVSHPLLVEYSARGLAIPVCPEVLGGLPVPRKPCEMRGPMVVTAMGDDFTGVFARGAALVLEIARARGIRHAVLKERSPSCGVASIYDGTFSFRLVPGRGVTTALLRKNGITVISDTDFLG